MTDSRKVGRCEVRSYFDKTQKRHFALFPPGDDKLSRLAIRCSVLDMTEDEITRLHWVTLAVQNWENPL